MIRRIRAALIITATKQLFVLKKKNYQLSSLFEYSKRSNLLEKRADYTCIIKDNIFNLHWSSAATLNGGA
jgi:hypothetical protein